MIKKIILLFNAKEKMDFFFIQFLIIISAFLEMSTVVAIVPMMNVFIDKNYIFKNEYILSIYNYFNFNDPNLFSIYFVSSIVLLFFLSTFIVFFSRLSIVKFSQNLMANIGSKLFFKYINMPYSFFYSENSFDVIRNLNEDLYRFITGHLQPLMILIARSILVIFITFSLLIVETKISIIFFSILSFFYFLVFLNIKKKLSSNGLILTRNNSEKIKIISETFKSIKEILISNKQNYFIDKHKNTVKSIASINIFNTLASLTPRYLLDSLFFLILVFYLIFIKFINNQNIESAITLVAFLSFAFYKTIPAFQEIYASLVQIRNNQNVLKNVSNIFNKNTIASEHKINFTQINLPKKIMIKNFCYYYNDRPEKEIFKNATIEISINEVTAIIGSTGSGKSTLIDILLGFHEINHGLIYLDSQKIVSQDLRKLWPSISYAPQNAYIINDTILSNICFAENLESVKQDKLNIALDISGLSELVKTLPNGINTIIGENAINLSGGQKQRLSLARVLYEDRPFIILDESFSAMDKNTSMQIFKKLAQLKNKTILLITHNLHLTKEANKVFKVEGSQIFKIEEN